jgi:hypothetical protein
MAAEATFHIRAVDSTRAGFASVQNSLTRIQKTAKTVSANIGTMFGATVAIAGVQRLNQALESVEANAKTYGMTSDEIARVTRSTGALDEAAKQLKLGLANTVTAVLELKDSITGVDKVANIDLAESIMAERDIPKIKEINEAIADLSRNTASLGKSDVAKFISFAEQIEKIGSKVDLTTQSGALNTTMRRLEIEKLKNEQAQISVTIMQDQIALEKELSEASEKLNASTLTEIEQQDKIIQGIDYYQTVVQSLTDEMQKFADVKTGIITIDENTVSLFDAQNTAMKELIRLIGLRKVAETDFQIIAKNTGDILSSGFEDAIFSGRKLSEVIKALGLDLARMVFQQTVTTPMAAGISSFLKNMFKASGGPVSSGSPYVVGEKGPELFVPNSSGSIIPNNKMGSGSSGAGGTNVNVTYNIASGVSRSDLAPILEQQRKLLKAEIPDMVRRGGGYRAAFA